jgi:hypothetical protein
MPAPIATRLAAAALVTGGLLGAAVPAAHPAHGPGYYTDPRTAPVHLLLFVAVLVVSLGLPGLVAAQPGRLRPWAAAGAVLLFVGEWLLDGTHGIVDGAVLPALVQHGAGPHAVATAGGAGLRDAALAHGAVNHATLAQALAAGPLGTLVDVGVPVIILGCVVLGVVLARGRVVPRTVAALLGLCWVLVPVSFVVPAVRGLDVALPYVAFAAVGGALLVRTRAARTAPAAEPRTVAAPRVAAFAAVE